LIEIYNKIGILNEEKITENLQKIKTVMIFDSIVSKDFKKILKILPGEFFLVWPKCFSWELETRHRLRG
jgi:hypothetical protein